MMQATLQRVHVLNQAARGKTVVIVACKPGDLSPEQMQKGLGTQINRSSQKPKSKGKRVIKREIQQQQEPIQPQTSSEESKSIQKDLQGRTKLMQGDKEAAAIERQVQNKGMPQENLNGAADNEISVPPEQEQKVASTAGTELPDGTIVFTEEDLQ